MSGVTHYQYTVPPFSQKPDDKVIDAAWKRAMRIEKATGAEFLDCGICGRPVQTTTLTWGIVIDGGGSWGTPESPEDNGHMGMFPIGPDCHRKYKATEATGCTA